MPAPELSHRYQKALLWRMTGYDANAQPTRSAQSEELSVRWVDKVSQALDPQNNVISVDATAIVDNDIDVGSIMWKGSMQDLADALPGTGTGTSSFEIPLSNIMRVVTFNATSDVKNRYTQRTAGLKRLSDAMPGVGT